MTSVNTEALHTTSKAMRDMMKINSTIQENLENLCLALKRKDDSKFSNLSYILGGLGLVAYAGGCYLFPAWGVYTWVTGGLAKCTVGAGGIAGVVSTGYGGRRYLSKEDEKSKERRDKGTIACFIYFIT